jgi:hypothetical protein
MSFLSHLPRQVVVSQLIQPFFVGADMAVLLRLDKPTRRFLLGEEGCLVWPNLLKRDGWMQNDATLLDITKSMAHAGEVARTYIALSSTTQSQANMHAPFPLLQALTSTIRHHRSCLGNEWRWWCGPVTCGGVPVGPSAFRNKSSDPILLGNAATVELSRYGQDLHLDMDAERGSSSVSPGFTIQVVVFHAIGHSIYLHDDSRHARTSGDGSGAGIFAIAGWYIRNRALCDALKNIKEPWLLILAVRTVARAFDDEDEEEVEDDEDDF